MADQEPIIVDTDGTRPVILRRTDIGSANDPRAKRLAVAANAIASADWNPDGELLAALAAEDDYIAQLVKNDDKAAKAMLEAQCDLVSDADAEPQVDKAAELQKKWKTESGQLWQLGEHRLLCGDSTKAEDVARIMVGEKADLYLCDPPFDLEPNKQATILNGLVARQILWMSATPSVYEVWRSLVRKDYRWTLFWEGGASMSVFNDHRPNISCSVFLCFGSDGLFRKQQAIRRMRLDSDCIPHCLRIGRDFTTHRLTPLMKPLLLFEGMVELLSEPDDLVCDWFVSSGTTIIACERLGRKCRAIEISPAYVAVTLERMATAFPNIKIELSND
jgi:site-specific DNA-methyltransferase (adenine-specific)